jgi:DNA modification methylase
MRRRQKRQELEARAAATPPLDPDAARVLHGDNLEVASQLGDAGERFKLVFTDPQYNNGTNYGQGAKADRLPESDFLEGLRVRFQAAARLLTDDGSIWALIDVLHSADLVHMLRELGLHQRAFITWYETFGQNCLGTFNRCSRHLLYFVKDPKRFVFHEDAVRRVSARLQLGDKRADPWGKLWDDVWGIEPPIPRLNDNDAERVPGFPTQLPLTLLRAVVGCATDPGDAVLDPYAGSCTTGVACLELGRRFVGIERRENFVELARQRLRREAAKGAS